jgi:hypothetical protein
MGVRIGAHREEAEAGGGGSTPGRARWPLPTLVAFGCRPSLVAPRRGPSLVASRRKPSVVAPRRGSSLVAPTRGPSLVASRRGSSLVAPTRGPSLVASRRGCSLVASRRGPSLVAPRRGSSLVARGSSLVALGSSLVASWRGSLARASVDRRGVRAPASGFRAGPRTLCFSRLVGLAGADGGEGRVVRGAPGLRRV